MKVFFINIKNAFLKLEKRDKILLSIFSIIFSFFNVFGEVYKTGYIKLSSFNLLYTIISFFIWFFLSFFILSIITYYLKKINLINNNQNYKLSNLKYFFISFLIIFIAWLIVHLAYYPGIFAYDAATQIYQLKYGYSVHHPLLHSLILNSFYIFGVDVLNNANLSIFIYTLLQALFLNFCLSYMNLFLYKIKLDKPIRIFLIIYEALMPIYSILSISITKDVPFTGFMVLTVASFLNLVYFPEESKKIKSKIFFLFSLLGFSLFRSQSIYILIALLVISFIFYRKNNKIINTLLIISIILGIGINTLLKISLNAIDVKWTEYYNIPIQSIERVYKTKYNKLDNKTIEDYYKLFRDPNYYSPFLSDNAKFNMNLNFPLFQKLFFKTLKEYPYTHFEAAIVLNLGYVYINDESHSQIYGKPYRSEYRSEHGYLLTDTKEGTEIYADTKIKPVEKFYEEIVTHNAYKNIPIINILFSLALYFYLFFYSILLTITKKKYELLFTHIFIFLYIGTMLLGPCAIVRYAFPYIATTIPLFFITLTNKNK